MREKVEEGRETVSESKSQTQNTKHLDEGNKNKKGIENHIEGQLIGSRKREWADTNYNNK